MNDVRIKIPHNFSPRNYQIPFLKEVYTAIKGESQKRFFYQIWHRRSGKDKCCISSVVPRRLIQDPCLVKYIYPTLVMGRDNLWNGIDGDGFCYLDHIPKEIRSSEVNSTRMTIKVKNTSETDSVFQVSGSNNPDSLRGGNPKLVIFSEWAEHDPYAWDVVEPILRENRGIAIFNTTPKGDNHARALYEYSKDHPDWFVQKITVEDSKIFTGEEMKQITEDTVKRFEASGRSQDEAIIYIQQEYYCSFDSPVLGAYFGVGIMKAEKEGRITNVPYEINVPVHTAWDLGIDDSMTIWFFQVCGLEIHFIDYYENSGEGIAHYAQVLQDKKYVYGTHYAPHDIQVRELGTGKSRLEVAKSLGIPFTPAPNLGIDDGINAARAVLNQCWFNKEKCYRGIQALKNYKKDWDDKNMVFRSSPLHDWASHGSDAFRMFAIAYRKPFKSAVNDPGGVKPYIPGIG